MNTPHLHKCFGDGMLVGKEHWIPFNAEEYNAIGSIVPAVGCNQLVCSRCNEQVLVLEGHALPADHEVAFDALYEALLLGGESEAEGVTSAPEPISADSLANLYLCHCHHHSERNTQLLDDFDEFRSLPLPWQCAGHPAAEFPATLDGIEVSLLDPLGPVVCELLAARVPLPLHPAIRNLAGFQALRVYRLLEGDAENQRRWSLAVVEQLLDPDPAVRRGALGFFRLAPRAEGAQEVRRHRRKRKLWSAPDPVDPRVTLKWTLDLAIAAIER